MKHYQNTLTGEVVSEDEYSYAAAQKGNWTLYKQFQSNATDIQAIKSAMKLREAVLWLHECEDVLDWLWRGRLFSWPLEKQHPTKEARKLMDCAKAAVIQLMEAMQ